MLSAPPVGLRIERLVDVRDLVDVAVYGRSVGEQALVQVEIPLRHDSIAESRFEFLPTPAAADSGKRAMPSTISAFVSQRNPVTPSHYNLRDEPRRRAIDGAPQARPR